MKIFTISILFFFLFLISCDTGYIKKNDEWVWAAYRGNTTRQFEKIEKHDFDSFKVLNENYAVDKNFVYYQTSIIKNADPNSFEIINDRFSKDIKSVYFLASKILFADPEYFNIIEFPYAKDNNLIFCISVPMNISKDEVEFFKVTNEKEFPNSVSGTTIENFINFYPEYKWLDTTGIKSIFYGSSGTAELNGKKFIGVKEIKN